MQNRRTPRRQRGLTFVEIAVTLTVLGLMLAFAAPQFMTYVRNTQVRNAAESIANGLQKARAEAVRRNQVVYFSLVSLTDNRTMDNSCALSETAGSWVISLESPSSNCGSPSEGQTNGTKVTTCATGSWCAPYIIEAHASAQGGVNTSVAAKASDNSTAANRLLFNGIGRVWTTAGPFSRPDSDTDGGAQCIDVSSTSGDADVRRLRVEVSDSGSVRMCDRGVTDTTDPRRCRACT